MIRYRRPATSAPPRPSRRANKAPDVFMRNKVFVAVRGKETFRIVLPGERVRRRLESTLVLFRPALTPSRFSFRPLRMHMILRMHHCVRVVQQFDRGGCRKPTGDILLRPFRRVAPSRPPESYSCFLPLTLTNFYDEGGCRRGRNGRGREVESVKSSQVLPELSGCKRLHAARTHTRVCTYMPGSRQKFKELGTRICASPKPEVPLAFLPSVALFQLS